jgi:hypothetical protein
MPNLMQSELEEMDRIEFVGLSDDAIEEERNEYVYVDPFRLIHMTYALLIM